MSTEQDPHRGRGGRYTIDDNGNRVPLVAPPIFQMSPPFNGTPLDPAQPAEAPAVIEAEQPAAEKPKQPKRSK